MNVDLLVGDRLQDGRTYPALGGQMHNYVVIPVKFRAEADYIANVCLNQPVRGMLQVGCHIDALDGRIVERVEVVDHGDGTALAQKMIDQVTPYKPGTACY